MPTGRAARVSTEISVPPDALLALDAAAADVGFDSTLLDLSPDGRTLVWVGSSPNGSVRLFARELDSFEIRPLAGTEGALHPFFSPDGRSLGFLTNDKVKTYSFVTGTTTTICDVTTGVTGTWIADDQVFFAAQEGRRLFRVNAGTARPSWSPMRGKAIDTGVSLLTESRCWSPTGKPVSAPTSRRSGW